MVLVSIGKICFPKGEDVSRLRRRDESAYANEMRRHRRRDENLTVRDESDKSNEMSRQSLRNGLKKEMRYLRYRDESDKSNEMSYLTVAR